MWIHMFLLVTLITSFPDLGREAKIYQCTRPDFCVWLLQLLSLQKSTSEVSSSEVTHCQLCSTEEMLQSFCNVCHGTSKVICWANQAKSDVGSVCMCALGCQLSVTLPCWRAKDIAPEVSCSTTSVFRSTPSKSVTVGS